MQTKKMNPTACAICGTEGNAKVLYRENFSNTAFSQEVFSARRSPDRIHFQIVKCNSCGLVRSDPIVDEKIVNQLYKQSQFTYDQIVPGLIKTYGRYLFMLEKWVPQKERLLEVGCGNGFFLEHALASGYKNVNGVEPSSPAIEKAKPEIKPNIICDIFQENIFPENYFDVVCFFQTFDHLQSPNAALKEVRRILKPEGLCLFINHNIASLSSRIMREKSPIIDIEHTYLYDLATMQKIVLNNGFKIIKKGSATNTYPIKYLLHLAPINKRIKNFANLIMKPIGLLDLSLPVYLGNLYLIAKNIKDK